VGFEPGGPAKSNDFVGKGAAAERSKFSNKKAILALVNEVVKLAATQSHRFRHR